MIKIKLGTPTQRKDVIVDPSTRLDDVFADNGFSLDSALVSINGASISKADNSKTLAELNVPDGAFVVSIVKADNA